MKLTFILIISLLTTNSFAGTGLQEPDYRAQPWQESKNVGMDVYLSGMTLWPCLALNTIRQHKDIAEFFQTESNLELLAQLNKKLTSEDKQLLQKIDRTEYFMFTDVMWEEVVALARQEPNSEQYFVGTELDYGKITNVWWQRSRDITKKYLIELGIPAENIQQDYYEQIEIVSPGSKVRTQVSIDLYNADRFEFSRYYEDGFDTNVLSWVGLADGQVTLDTGSLLDPGYVLLTDFMANLPRVEAFCKEQNF